MQPTQYEAYETIDHQGPRPILVSCEHASNRLPDAWSWPENDTRLIDMHWAFDLGARALALEVAQSFDAPLVMSRFTRLLADPNRPEDSPTLFRDIADDLPVHLNLNIHPDDVAKRLEQYHRPYHQALEDSIAKHAAKRLLSIHSFTPLYEGQKRELEVGVLFDLDEELAKEVLAAVQAAGFRAALNEPYSGKAGLMFAVDRHARKVGAECIEIEFRQDLAVIPEQRARLVDALGILVP